VVIGSCAGTLYALRRDTGKPLWVYDATADSDHPQFHGEPLLRGDAIIVPTDAESNGYVYSFDVRTGELRWKVPFKGGVGTTPLIVGDKLIVAAADGSVAAIDPSTGNVLWKVSTAGTMAALPGIPSPAEADGMIFVADTMGNVFGLDGATGKTVWRKPLSGRVNTSLLVVGKALLGGTIDGYLYRLATKSGDVEERVKLAGFPYGTLISSPPLLLMLVKGDDAHLVAFETATSKIRWQRATPKEWTTYRPLVVGASVIVGSEERDLCAFRLTDGAQRWCQAVGQIPRGLGVSADGMLYVGTLAGRVSAYHHDAAEKAKTEQP
jgi:outer membrane protein assembly factor BamB